MAFEADYVYSQGRDEKDVVDNINLAFNPATGANYPVTDRARLPYPDWGVVSMNTHLGRSAYHGLQTGFTKRFSHRWQASATYTLSGLWNADTQAVQRPDAGDRSTPHPIWAVNGVCRPTTSATGRCSTASGRWATASR